MRYDVYADRNVPLLDIIQMGGSSDPQVTDFGPARRNQYIVHYALAGSGTFNGARVCVGQGFLIAPGERERYIPDPADPWTLLWLVSTDCAMRDFFHLYNADPATRVFSYRAIDAAQSVMDYVMRYSGQIRPATELLEQYLRLFNTHAAVGSRAVRSNAALYYQFAVDYIAANLQNGVTVKALLRQLGISQPCLFRIFQARAGRSPQQYINDCKVRQARKMLADPTLTISNIAQALGYADSHAFTRFFTDQTGTAPGRYRAALRHTADEISASRA